MRRELAIAGINTVVQIIHVAWEKSGRGGLTAEHRNRIPSALPLPEALVPEPGRHLLIHQSHWHHSNDFRMETSHNVETAAKENVFRYRCVSIRSEADHAELEWTWNEWAGVPARKFWNAEGKAIPATHRSIATTREWVRASWNGRFTCIDSGSWWYESVTVNVGICTYPEIPEDFFLSSKPQEDFSQMMYLR